MKWNQKGIELFRSKTGSQKNNAFKSISNLEFIVSQTIDQNMKIKEIHFHFQTCQTQETKKNQEVIGGCDSPKQGDTPRMRMTWNQEIGYPIQVRIPSVMDGNPRSMIIALQLT